MMEVLESDLGLSGTERGGRLVQCQVCGTVGILAFEPLVSLVRTSSRSS